MWTSSTSPFKKTKQKHPHAHGQHLGHLWNLSLAISKLNLCPSSVYGSPGTLHSGSLLRTASAEMDHARVRLLLYSRTVRTRKKKPTKQEPSPSRRTLIIFWQTLTILDLTAPSLLACGFHKLTMHSGIDSKKQDSHMRERDGFPPPPPHLSHQVSVIKRCI